MKTVYAFSAHVKIIAQWESHVCSSVWFHRDTIHGTRLKRNIEDSALDVSE